MDCIQHGSDHSIILHAFYVHNRLQNTNFGQFEVFQKRYFQYYDHLFLDRKNISSLSTPNNIFTPSNRGGGHEIIQETYGILFQNRPHKYVDLRPTGITQK